MTGAASFRRMLGRSGVECEFHSVRIRIRRHSVDKNSTHLVVNLLVEPLRERSRAWLIRQRKLKKRRCRIKAGRAHEGPDDDEGCIEGERYTGVWQDTFDRRSPFVTLKVKRDLDKSHWSRSGLTRCA